jgi:hypothetical protein
MPANAPPVSDRYLANTRFPTGAESVVKSTVPLPIARSPVDPSKRSVELPKMSIAKSPRSVNPPVAVRVPKTPTPPGLTVEPRAPIAGPERMPPPVRV